MNKFFYSNKCSDCQGLWNAIENKGLVNLFTPICLDSMTVEEIKSMKLKVVPTIISFQNNNLTMHQGKQKCIKILNEMTENNKTKDIKILNKNDNKSDNKYYEHDNSLEYCEQEMEGIGDYYSYNTENTDNITYQPKNYVKVGEEVENYITAPLVGTSNGKYNPNIQPIMKKQN